MKREGEERHLSIRLESLTDMVFGLALSIGALLLAISGIGSAAQIESNLVTFGFSFLILIYVWMRYTAIVADLPEKVRERRMTTYITAALLFLVAVEPYLFNILHTITISSVLGFASAVYALDIGLIMLILSSLINTLIKCDVKSNNKLTISRRYIYIRSGTLSIAVIMLVSALPIFWQTELFGIHTRFLMWVVIIPLMTLTRLVKNTRREKNH
jgi:hypothetical protein